MDKAQDGIVNISICEYSPPYMDGRIARIQSLAKYLNSHGIEVNIYSFGPSNSKKDLGYCNLYQVEFPGMNFVDHSSSNSPSYWYVRLLKKITDYIYPDRYILLVNRLVNLVSENMISGSFLILSVPRFSLLFILLFRRIIKSNCKIYVDYRDLWSNNKIFTNSITRLLTTFIERKLLKNVCGIITTTDSAANYMRKIHNNVLVVSNGVASSDVELITKLKNELNVKLKTGRNIRNHMSYFGTLGNKRDCVNFLRKLMDIGIELNLYGNIDRRHKTLLPDTFKGFLDKPEMFRKCITTDFILIVITADENDQFAIPGKIYESVVTCTPIVLYSSSSSLACKYLKDIDYPFALFEIDEDYSLEIIQERLDNLLKKSHLSSYQHKYVVREDEYRKLVNFIFAR